MLGYLYSQSHVHTAFSAPSRHVSAVQLQPGMLAVDNVSVFSIFTPRVRLTVNPLSLNKWLDYSHELGSISKIEQNQKTIQINQIHDANSRLACGRRCIRCCLAGSHGVFLAAGEQSLSGVC